MSSSGYKDKDDISISKNKENMDKQNAQRNHLMARQLKREDRISFLEGTQRNGVQLSIPEQKE